MSDTQDALTHARVLRIAIPIVLSSSTTAILGLVDTGVIGQMGQAAPIGAVGVGATILAAVYWIFGFLRMGTTGLVGQAVGAGDDAEVSAYFSRAMMIAAAAGAVLIALQAPIIWIALGMLPSSAEVETLTRDYLMIRIWAAPAAIGVFAITGWLIAMERTGRVLAVQLVMNGLNIILDIWFVIGLGWGVKGVAFATLIAEFTGLALGLWLCREALLHPAWRTAARIFDKAKLTRMALINMDILIRSAALLAIFTSFQFFGARFGEVTLAANQVLLQFLTLSAFALDGFAFTAETLVAKSVGRKDLGHLRRAVWLSSLWGVISAVVMTLCFVLFGGVLIDIMTTSPEVRSDARIYLWWVAVSPLVGVGAFMLDGIFIGATRGPDLRNMMVVSLLIYVAAVAALMPNFANHGLWAALTISLIVRMVTLAVRYPALERDILVEQ